MDSLKRAGIRTRSLNNMWDFTPLTLEYVIIKSDGITKKKKENKTVSFSMIFSFISVK